MRFAEQHQHGTPGPLGQNRSDPAGGVGVTPAEAVESAPRRAIESDDRNGERPGPIKQVAESLPRVAPLLPVVDPAEKRLVVDRTFLTPVEDLLLSRVDEFDAEDDPAARRQGLEQIRRDALAARIGVEIPDVDHIRGDARTDETIVSDPAVRRRDFSPEIAEVRVAKGAVRSEQVSLETPHRRTLSGEQRASARSRTPGHADPQRSLWLRVVSSP